MVINRQITNVSKSALKSITDYGTILIIRKATIQDAELPTTEEEELMKMYKEHYNQEIDHKPNFDGTPITINCLVNYSPTREILDGIGYYEKCDLVANMVTKDFIEKVGLNIAETTVDTLLSYIRDSKVIEIDSRHYIVESVQPTSIYMGFPIMLAIVCNLYK